MQSQDLAAKLSPYSLLLNAAALSVNYRALAIGPTRVRACAMFGAMETEVAIGVQQEVHVDGDNFLHLLRSLPAADLEIAVEGQALVWKCGAASGKLALLGDGVQVAAAEWPDEVVPAEVGPAFGRGLDLGSMACGTSALQSVGLYGVSLVLEGDAWAYSSDNNTIAGAKLGAFAAKAKQATLSATGARLLSLLASKDRASVAIPDEQTIYCRTPDTKLVLKQIPRLKFAIRDMLQAFLPETIRVPMKRDVITAFVKRSEALTEDKKRTDVSIAVEGGAVRLSFSEGRSSSMEHYDLAEGGPDVVVPPILIDSRRLSRALSSTTHVVFDHVSRGALVLRGEGDFVFVISGKRSEVNQ